MSPASMTTSRPACSNTSWPEIKRQTKASSLCIRAQWYRVCETLIGAVLRRTRPRSAKAPACSSAWKVGAFRRGVMNNQVLARDIVPVVKPVARMNLRREKSLSIVSDPALCSMSRALVPS